MSRFLSILLYLIGFTYSTSLFGQDTLLVDFKPFPVSIDWITADGKGTIWISSGLGFYTFDGETTQWIKPNPKREILMLWNGNIQPYTQLSGQRILLNKQTETNKNWGKFLPLGSAQIISSARDKKGRIWVAKGPYLFCFNVHTKFTSTYRGKSIRGILPLGSQLLVGTYSGIYLDEQLILPDSIYSNGSILPWGKEEVLIPYGYALKYNIRTNKWKSIDYSKSIVDLPKKLTVFKFARQANRLWAASSIGLLKLEGDSIQPTTLTQPLEDIYLHKQQLYLATHRGIYTSDGTTHTRLTAFPDIFFTSIQYIDHTWWATSKEGIWKWKPGQKKATQLFKNQLLEKLETYVLVKDALGYYWVSCISGIVRFKPDGETYEHFLQQIEFNKWSAAQQGDTLYFGSLNGVFKCHPSQFDPPKIPVAKKNPAYWILPGALGALLIISIFTLTLFMKYRRVSRLLASKLQKSDAPVDPFLVQLAEYIEQNISTVTVQALIDHTGLSRRGLYQVLETTHRLKPGDLIRNIKQNRIQEILRDNPGISNEELGSQVGYSPYHISRILERKEE